MEEKGGVSILSHTELRDFATTIITLFKPRLNRIIASSILAFAILCLIVFHDSPQNYEHYLGTSQNSKTGGRINKNSTDEPNDRRNATIAKVTMLWGDDATAPVMTGALASHERHAERLGYPMKVLRYSLANHYWNKVYWLQEIIVHELSKPPNERLEWLMWADADTILLNPSFHLEAFLPPHDMKNIHFICAKDWNGLNNGVFFMRVSEETAEYVARVIAYPLFKPEVHLEWPEQTAMQLTFNESVQYHEQVAYMPQHWFNGYIKEVQPGDLLAHFAGVERRHEEMEAWLKKIEGPNAADYDIYDPWSPSLHKRIMEIGHFWEIVQTFRGIAAKLNDAFFDSNEMHIADMPDNVFGTLARFKDVCYFSTDDEGVLARALMTAEDAVKRMYGKELSELLKYNPDWRLLMRNGRLDDGAFQKPTKLEEFH